MFVCVLTSPTGDPNVIDDYTPAPYLDGYEWEHHVLEPPNLEEKVEALIARGFDVFLNLTVGSYDDLLYHLPEILDNLGAPYTGSYGSFYDPTRAGMKEGARLAGVPFPGTCFVKSEADIQHAVDILRFPLIVKPPHGYASTDVFKESRVIEREGLQKQARFIVGKYGSALIEEFIDGRELTALVAENPDDPQRPITFRTVEYLFPEGELFKHADMKWVDYMHMRARPVPESDVDARVRDYCARLFKSLNGNGYARCDFRMNSLGQIFMLEINPNCGVFNGIDDPACADVILLNDPMQHKGFLGLIIRQALKRRGKVF